MDEENRRPLPRTGYPRRRAVAACLTCRERKRKCDNLRPACSSCQQIGTRCQYGRQDESSFDAPSLRILDQLAVIKGLLIDLKPTSGVNFLSTPAGSHGLLQQQQHLLQQIRQCIPAHTVSHEFVLKVDCTLSPGTDKLLQWPIFDNLLAHRQRFRLIDFRGAGTYTYLDDLSRFSHISEAPARIEPLWHSSPLVNISTERSDIDMLVDHFFRRVNIKNPIISRRIANQHCQQYYEHGPQFNLETCLVLLICALGAISTDYNPYDMGQSHQSPSAQPARLHGLRLGRCYFVAAEKRLGAAMSDIGTLAIQCLCLAGMYHMYSINPLSALRMFQAAASSLQILESTSGVSADGMSQLSSSLAWMCYKSEREILTEIPISAPTLNESSFLNSYPPPPQSLSTVSDEESMASEEDSWYFFLSEIALRRITDQVVEVVDRYISPKLHSRESRTTAIEDLIPIVAEFEQQAEAFRSQLPPAVDFPDVPQAASTEWKQYSRGRYYRLLELMHRPFLFAALHGLDTCSPQVQRLAEKCLVNALRYLQHSLTSHRHHGLWLQLRNQLKQATLLIAASRLVTAATALKLPEEWEAAVAKTLQTFEYWAWEYPPCTTYASILLALSDSPLANAHQDDPIIYS